MRALLRGTAELGWAYRLHPAGRPVEWWFHRHEMTADGTRVSPPEAYSGNIVADRLEPRGVRVKRSEIILSPDEVL